MKNPKLRGLGTVYRYTVQQHYKTRSVIIFLIVLLVISVSSLPLTVMLNGGRKQATETQIKQLYLHNESGFPIDAEDIRLNTLYADLTVTETEDDEETANQKLESERSAVYSVIAADPETMAFTIRTNYGMNGNVTAADAASLNSTLSSALHKALLRSLSVTEAQEAMLHCKTQSQVSRVSDFLRGTEEVSTGTHVSANIFYCVFIMTLSGLSMGYIFQLCMEEKISKLVESLLVSVSPTALLIGKILGATTFIFAGLGLCGCGLAVSWQIAKRVGDVSVLTALLSAQGMPVDFTSLHFSAGTIILFAVCLLLAYAIAVAFSGIVGSCCSKTEDTQQASLAVTMFLMIGYFAGAFVPMFENDAANAFCSLFPLTSIFTAFPNYVCGKIGLPIFVAGLLFQAATALLLAMFAGMVYRMMLLYRGSFPKPKQIVRMLREERAAGKETHHAEQ